MTTLFDPTAHPNRYDLSVNEARVEGAPGPSGVATPTPSMMLVVGDSSFRRQRYIKVTSVKINGAPA